MTNGEVFVPIEWPKARTPTPTAVTTTATAAAIASRRRSERDTRATLWHPGRVRRLAALALAAVTLGGCGSATVHELPPAAEPARARPRPPRARRPAWSTSATRPRASPPTRAPRSSPSALRDPDQLALVDASAGR